MTKKEREKTSNRKEIQELQGDERYRAILENIEDAYFEVDIAGNFTFFNNAVCRLLGYSNDEVMGMNSRQYTDPENAKKLYQTFNTVYRTGIPIKGFEWELIRKDGTKRYGEVSISLIRDPYGQAIGFRGIARDTTERKKIEEALALSKERYRTLVEESFDGIFIQRGVNIIFANRRLYEMLGYKETELEGLDHWLVYHPDYQALTRERAQARMRGESVPSTYEVKFLRKDGSSFWGEINAKVINFLGEPGIQVWAKDITKRKRSEEEAKRLAQENTTVIEIGQIISSTLNIDKVYERFSEEVRKLIPFDRIVINSINIEKGTVINAYIAGKGIVNRETEKIYPLQGSGNEEMVRTKSTLLVQTEDFNEYKDRFPMLLSTFQSGFRSIMNVPLFSKGQIIGGLLLRSLKPYAYTDKDVRLAERVGHQIAGAVANAQLFAELNRAEQEQRKLILQLQESLARVKALSGLIPICASCKKIRDDKGYWNQLETYIRDRSEAEFSHGICPECSRKLYPDFFDDEGKEKV